MISCLNPWYAIEIKHVLVFSIRKLSFGSIVQGVLMSKTAKKAAEVIMVGLIVSCSCAVLKPNLIGEDGFKTNATRMDVYGRSGWNVNKQLQFGFFHTDTFTYGFIEKNTDELRGSHLTAGMENLAISFSQIKEHYAFKQYDSAGNVVKVTCTAHRSVKNSSFGAHFSGETVLEDYCEIKIRYGNAEQTISYSKDLATTAQIGKDSIMVMNEFKLDHAKSRIFQGVLFKVHSETIAAVDLTNQGIVWIKNDLNSFQKLTMAAIATAIIMAPDLTCKK